MKVASPGEIVPHSAAATHVGCGVLSPSPLSLSSFCALELMAAIHSVSSCAPAPASALRPGGGPEGLPGGTT